MHGHTYLFKATFRGYQRNAGARLMVKQKVRVKGGQRGDGMM